MPIGSSCLQSHAKAIKYANDFISVDAQNSLEIEIELTNRSVVSLAVRCSDFRCACCIDF